VNTNPQWIVTPREREGKTEREIEREKFKANEAKNFYITYNQLNAVPV